MREIISNQPEKWQGRHLLMCTHSFNSKSKILYLMYCDIIKEMPNRRLKIKVYGDRHVSICGEKIRYAGIGDDGSRVGKQDAFQAGSKNKICVKLISLFCYT